jgi:hypothetical protein
MPIQFFKAKITRARHTLSNLSSADMLEISNEFVLKMKQRILAAQTIDDTDAKPLTEKYKKNKIRKTPFPYRNLYYSGDMLRAMRTLRVDQNKAEIFFSYGPMAQRMAYNQRKSRQWGVSPSDAKRLSQLVNAKVQIKVERGVASKTIAA